MAYPPLADLLPHRPPMLLLDALTAAEDHSVACSVTVRDGAPFVGPPFADAGKASSLLAVEYFAQAVAALFAFKALGSPDPFKGGVLLGVRDLELDVPHLAAGDTLGVTCREQWASGPVAHYQCTLHRGPERLAAGSITVLQGDPNALELAQGPT